MKSDMNVFMYALYLIFKRNYINISITTQKGEKEKLSNKF